MIYINTYSDFLLEKNLIDYFFNKKSTKRIDPANISDGWSEPLYIRFEAQIKANKTPEENLTFLDKILSKINDLDLKKWAIRTFLTMLAISLQSNEPIPRDVEDILGKKVNKTEIEINVRTPQYSELSNEELNRIYNDTLDRIKYDLPSEKAAYKGYEDLINYKMHLESRGNWKIYNKFGFMGLFQMGEKELKGVGYGNVTFEKFKEDPTIFPPKDQRIAYDRLIRLNKYFLRTHMKYVGQTIGGIYITEGSIVGASTIGVGNVKTFLDTDGKVDPKDGFGIPTSFLIKKFQSYDVSNIKPMTYTEWMKLKYGRVQ